MEKNNVYNLLNQITQESKSLWRIQNNYVKEVQTEEEKVFWERMIKDKETHITEMREIVKKFI